MKVSLALLATAAILSLGATAPANEPILTEAPAVEAAITAPEIAYTSPQFVEIPSATRAIVETPEIAAIPQYVPIEAPVVPAEAPMEIVEIPEEIVEPTEIVEEPAATPTVHPAHEICLTDQSQCVQAEDGSWVSPGFYEDEPFIFDEECIMDNPEGTLEAAEDLTASE